MNKLQSLALLWKTPKSKINFDTLGYVHKTGEISFANSEAALNYAKKRVVSALNYENGKRPFERGFIIHNNVILAQADGSSNSVFLKLDEKYKDLDVITVHGHPDGTIHRIEQFVRKMLSKFKKQTQKSVNQTDGITNPINFHDYRIFMMSPNETQSIVFNSKGQYSKLTKLECSKEIGYNELKEIENEYMMNVPSGYIYQLARGIKSLIRGFYSPEKAYILNKKDALKHQSQISGFWENSAEKLCKVKYETDFFKI